MIILFAPAKSFQLDHPTKEHHQLRPQTEKLIQKLAKLSKHEIEQKFKLSSNLVDDVASYYRHFDENAAYLAIDLYHGESYKTLDAKSLTEEERAFLNDHVLIVDALYGIISPLESIKPYRLDFTISGLDLNNLWKPVYEAMFKHQSEPVLSLASDEFSSKIKPFVAIYEVHFMDCKNGVCKSISVFNKQQRGALLRHIVVNRILKVEDLPLVFNGYHLQKNGFDLKYIKSID